MRQIQAIGEPSHSGRTWTIQERSAVQLQARSRNDLDRLAVLHLRLSVSDDLLLAGQTPYHLHSPAFVLPQLNLPSASLALLDDKDSHRIAPEFTVAATVRMNITFFV